MYHNSPTQSDELSTESVSSGSIILVADATRQVIDSEITSLEAIEILWLLSQIKKYGFAAVEETLVHYLIASDHHDYTQQP